MKFKLETKKIVMVAVFAIAVFIFFSILYCRLYVNCIYSTNAVIRTDNEVVYSMISGKVEKVLLDNNSNVQKGEIIAVMNSDEFQKELDEANSKLEKAKIDFEISKDDVNKMNIALKKNEDEIKNAKNNLESANSDYIRYKNAYKDGVVTKNDYNKAIKNLDIATKQYEEIQANIKENDYELKNLLSKKTEKNDEIKKLLSEIEQIRLNLSYTSIISPKEGVLVDLALKPDKLIKADEPIFSIVDANCYVTAKFKSDEYVKLKKGQNVIIKLKPYSIRGFKGTIDEINTGENQDEVKIVFNKNVYKNSSLSGKSVTVRAYVK